MPRTLLVGLSYFAIGFIFAALAGGATRQARVAWRLTAWLLSAIVFASHVRYEYPRVDKSPTRTAWRAATAVALGAFGLALVPTSANRSPSPPNDRR